MKRNKTARNNAKRKAKQRRRSARRQGVLKVRRKGGRMTGKVTKARHN